MTPAQKRSDTRSGRVRPSHARPDWVRIIARQLRVPKKLSEATLV
ncbi:hypothetical protein GCM10028819_02580 [Spirosoma humi]